MEYIQMVQEIMAFLQLRDIPVRFILITVDGCASE
jgi:hypothetical protein